MFAAFASIAENPHNAAWALGKYSSKNTPLNVPARTVFKDGLIDGTEEVTKTVGSETAPPLTSTSLSTAVEGGATATTTTTTSSQSSDTAAPLPPVPVPTTPVDSFDFSNSFATVEYTHLIILERERILEIAKTARDKIQEDLAPPARRVDSEAEQPSSSAAGNDDYEEEEEVDDGEALDYDTCYKCGLNGQLLLCEKCENVAHVMCAGLLAVPEGDWICDVCKKEAKIEESQA